MENATKALLIAAAILIAIVIITLGVFVLGQGSNMVKENSDLSGVEVSTFNQKFEQYFGEKVRGVNVKALLTTIKNNNDTNDDDTKQVHITNDSVINEDGTKPVKTGKVYKVEASKYTNGGLISEIKVSEVTNE